MGLVQVLIVKKLVLKRGSACSRAASHPQEPKTSTDVRNRCLLLLGFTKIHLIAIVNSVERNLLKPLVESMV